MGGDVSGTADAATVVAARGRTIASTAPSNGQVLTWVSASSNWAPATPSASSGAGTGVLTVAASDAPASLIARADYTCDGTADQVQINQALTDSLLQGGTGNRYGAVQLTAGTFNLAAPIIIPSRGVALMGAGGASSMLLAAAGFADAGEGTGSALIKLASTAAARNSVAVYISDLWLSGESRGVGGIFFDQSGGTMDGNSDATYGQPTGGTGYDAYHSFNRLRIRQTTTGIKTTGTSGCPRGINIFDVRQSGPTVAGYDIDSSDCHIHQTHVITDNGSSAVYGFYIRGGNARLTGCKAAYMSNTNSWGFYISSDRASLVACEAQDNLNGVTLLSRQDTVIAGLRVETQESPCTTAVQLSGTTNSTCITGLYIHTRETGSYANGLYLPTASATTGIGDHMIQAIIDGEDTSPPAPYITNPLRAGSNTNPTLADLEGSQGRGCYQIRVAGNPGKTLVST